VKENHVGYTAEELAESPYADFYNPEIAPLQPQVAEAQLVGAVAHELMYPVERSPEMLSGDDWPVENGYAYGPGGSLRVFCSIDMPGVTPAMWDWWFGWHGSEAQRYRLWHPRAHVNVGWKDGRDDLSHYVGRISHIEEYLGSNSIKAAVCFIPPSQMGLDEQLLADRGEVAICARTALPNTPIKAGWLLHHIRPVEGGAQMRQRMWFGGENFSFGDNPGPLGKALGLGLKPVIKRMLPNPAEMLAHAAQEMAHLAGFLPELYQRFNSADSAADVSQE